MKQFHQKEGAFLRRYWAATQSTCRILPSYKHFPPIPRFVHPVHTKPPLSREWTLVPSCCVHMSTFSLEQRLKAPCQIEQGLIILFITTDPVFNWVFSLPLSFLCVADTACLSQLTRAWGRDPNKTTAKHLVLFFCPKKNYQQQKYRNCRFPNTHVGALRYPFRSKNWSSQIMILTVK